MSEEKYSAQNERAIEVLKYAGGFMLYALPGFLITLFLFIAYAKDFYNNIFLSVIGALFVGLFVSIPAWLAIFIILSIPYYVLTGDNIFSKPPFSGGDGKEDPDAESGH